MELSAKYITDRKLPDKAIDVIDEAGASQMLLPGRPSGRKTIGQEEIESVIAKMARIPAKSVSKSDTEALKSLEADLKRAVYGQDEAIHAAVGGHEAVAGRACARGRSRSAPTCSPAPPASARPRWRASWPRRSASSCCAST